VSTSTSTHLPSLVFQHNNDVGQAVVENSLRELNNVYRNVLSLVGPAFSLSLNLNGGVNSRAEEEDDDDDEDDEEDDEEEEEPVVSLQDLNLPQFSFKNDCDINEKMCVIFQEDYQEGDDLTSLACVHNFHSGCLSKWLACKLECPLCKEEVVT